MVIVWLIGVGLALRRSARPTLYGLAWLVIIWSPILLLVVRIHSRYLMPGLFPAAMLFGAGMAGLMQVRLPGLPRQAQATFWRAAVGVFLAGWAFLFAWPFAVNAANHATTLRMPYFDNRDYFQSRLNAYGLLPALGYLQQTGQRVEGRAPVMMVAYLCDRLELYAVAAVDLTCLGQEYTGAEPPEFWQHVLDRASPQLPLYLIIEQPRQATAPLEEPPFPSPGLEWDRLAVFRRPKHGLWVTVWEVKVVDTSTIEQDQDTPQD
jgi:hypothetical protein